MTVVPSEVALVPLLKVARELSYCYIKTQWVAVNKPREHPHKTQLQAVPDFGLLSPIISQKSL